MLAVQWLRGHASMATTTAISPPPTKSFQLRPRAFEPSDRASRLGPAGSTLGQLCDLAMYVAEDAGAYVCLAVHDAVHHEAELGGRMDFVVLVVSR